MNNFDRKKKIRFIINPKSGTQRKKNINKIICKLFHNQPVDYDIFFTKRSNHATLLSQDAVALKYDIVIAVGGDGTVNEIAKSLIDSKTALAIVPMGSGNGYSRHLKIPLKIDKAILSILNSKYKLVDTLKINNEFFLSIAGLGFDAYIAKIFANSKKRGFWSYTKLVIREFFTYKSEKYELLVDGERMFKKAFLLSFAKSSQYGNNIIIAPHAKIDDGYFNLAILKRPPLYAIIDVFMKLKNGSINKSKYYESYKCKEVIIRKNNIIAHMDGEPFSFEKEAKIIVYPKSLKVLIP